VPTDDDGLLACGSYRPAPENQQTDIALLKFDVYGDFQWLKTIDLREKDYVRSINTTKSGYVIIGGSMITLDQNADIIWSNTIHGSDIHQTEDDGFIICGFLTITKTDEQGTIQWQHRFKGKPQFNSVQQTKDGGFVTCGTIDQKHWRMVVIKTDPEGVT